MTNLRFWEPDFDWPRRLDWEVVFSWLNPRKGQTVCDLGCGNGRLACKISQLGLEAHGIDVRQGHWSTAEASFCLAAAECLPYRQGVFDKLICNSSLEHFRSDIKAVSEMKRVARKGCSLIITVDSFTWDKCARFKKAHRDRHNVVNYYSLSSAKSLLEACGFNVQQHRFYVNSPLSVFLFELGSRMGYLAFLYRLLYPFSYPLVKVSDRFFGHKDKGLILAVQAVGK
jgi:SAM-dependent methyltransferase